MTTRGTHPRAEAYLDAYDIHPHTTTTVSERHVGSKPTEFVINYGGATWILAFRQFPDHQSVDIDLFDDTPDVTIHHKGTSGAQTAPDAPSTPIGVFSIHQGRRHTLQEDTLPTNHRHPATVGLVLLADTVPPEDR